MAGVNPNNKLFLEVKEEEVNLKKYPKNLNTSKDPRVAIKGDLHGNFLMLIHFCIQNGIIYLETKEEDIYQEFVNFYYTRLSGHSFSNKNDNEKLIHDFEELLLNIKATDDRVVLRLIGDVMADRGPCDYLTLLLLQHFQSLSIGYNVLFSNHDNWFLEYLNNSKHKDREPIPNVSRWARSLENLNFLLKTNPEFIQNFQTFGQEYQTHIRLIDYIREGQELTMLTHAPNLPWIVKAVAERY